MYILYSILHLLKTVCTGSVLYAKAQIIFDTVCRISNSILKSKWWFFQDFSLYKVHKIANFEKFEGS